MKPRDLAQRIFDIDPIVRQTDTSLIFDSGDRIPKKKFFDDFFLMDNLLDFDQEYALEFKSFGSERKRKIKHRVKEYLSEIVDEHIAANRPTLHNLEAKENSDVVTSQYQFSDFMLFRSLLRDNAGEQFVYDLVNNTLTDIDPDFYLKSLPKEYRANFTPNACVFEYDPYNLKPTKLIELYRQPVTQINLYRPPSWRLMESTEGKARAPKDIAKFMCHVFPNPEARAFVICWLKNMILYRNYTYLGLNGVKGLGKNIFVENLCTKLVGEENFGKGNLSLLNKEFNTVLKNKRLIFLDELKIGKKQHTKLKDIINPKQNIEAKGVDANNVTVTHNSLIISNNDSHDVYVEHDDRRFSWIPLTDVPLNQAYTAKEIDALITSLDDPETIRQFGEFILQYEHDVYEDPTFVWKCEKFHSLVVGSLKSWEQYLIDYLQEVGDKGVSLKWAKEDAEDQGIMFPTNRAKVESFLLNYRHRGEDRIGRLEKVGKEWTLFSEKITKIEDEL